MDNATCVHILDEVLTKKIKILEDISNITISQTEALDNNDVEKFENCIDLKSEAIHKLEQLDLGFEQIFLGVKDEISQNKDNYKDIIINFQKKIVQIMDQSAKIQSVEGKNKQKFNIVISNEEKKIKDIKVSNNIAHSYYKNMMNMQTQESLFLDKKK